jgi:PhnB protein
MSARLNPYLSFPGNAREAMEFYQSIFGGDLEVNTFADYGGAPEGVAPDAVMHAMLTTDAGFVIMASDGGEEPSGQSSITMSLSGTDDSIRGYWDKLSADGKVTMPFEKQVWGDEFGMCIDKYQVPWMVDIGTGD